MQGLKRQKLEMANQKTYQDGMIELQTNDTYKKFP